MKEIYDFAKGQIRYIIEALKPNDNHKCMFKKKDVMDLTKTPKCMICGRILNINE